MLVLRLYDTPVGVATRAAREVPMPESVRSPVQAAVRSHEVRHDGTLMRWLLWLLAGALLGGIVHLVTILVLPTDRDPGRLFAAGGADAAAQRLRRRSIRPRRKPPLPFSDPAFAIAVCRYDLECRPDQADRAGERAPIRR